MGRWAVSCGRGPAKRAHPCPQAALPGIYPLGSVAGGRQPHQSVGGACDHRAVGRLGHDASLEHLQGPGAGAEHAGCRECTGEGQQPGKRRVAGRSRQADSLKTAGHTALAASAEARPATPRAAGVLLPAAQRTACHPCPHIVVVPTVELQRLGAQLPVPEAHLSMAGKAPRAVSSRRARGALTQCVCERPHLPACLPALAHMQARHLCKPVQPSGRRTCMSSEPLTRSWPSGEKCTVLTQPARRSERQQQSEGRSCRLLVLTALLCVSPTHIPLSRIAALLTATDQCA